MLDYIRIACAVPSVRVADTVQNAGDICDKIAEADRAGCDLVMFPELAVTGYTCADLFFQQTLLDASVAALNDICTCWKDSRGTWLPGQGDTVLSNISDLWFGRWSR